MAAAALVLLSLLLLDQSPHSTADAPSVKLMNAAKDGVMMPVAGIGTGGYNRDPTGPGEYWTDDVAEKAIAQWLAVGGRRVDGSVDYGDQVGIGKAIRASGLRREEIFMTSKTTVALPDYNSTLQQMNKILSDLKMAYVDLLLIHWPGTPPSATGTSMTNRELRQSCWKALEYLFNNGKARAIGVSNFEVNHIQDIVDLKGLLPAVNQVEYHPFWHKDDLVEYCQKMNITFNGYAPLGTPDWAPIKRGWDRSVLNDPTVVGIAQAHGCTPAQVVQQWQWKQGIVINPRSMNVTHMKENLNFFNVQLTAADMKAISSIKPPNNPKVCPDPHNIP